MRYVEIITRESHPHLAQIRLATTQVDRLQRLLASNAALQLLSVLDGGGGCSRVWVGCATAGARDHLLTTWA